MKSHTTNYTNTFIEVAEDCPVNEAEIPKAKGDTKTVAELQLEMILKHPYKYTSDDVLFQVFAQRNEVAKSDYKKERENFFSKGQACFRASPLTKRYGFGVHSDEKGCIALVAKGTKEYELFLKDKSIKKVKAMRSAKK
jgi:hypothetical protein